MRNILLVSTIWTMLILGPINSVAQSGSEFEQKGSGLFGEYAQRETIASLRSAHPSGDIIIKFSPMQEAGVRPSRSMGEQSPFVDPLYRADVVLTGKLISVRPYPTADDSFVFTRCVVQVDEVIKDETHSLSSGSLITVVRAGGTLLLDGRRISAMDPNFPPFRIDHTYAFFAKAEEGASIFKVDADDAFELGHSGVSVLARSPRRNYPPEVMKSADAFLAELRYLDGSISRKDMER